MLKRPFQFKYRTQLATCLFEWPMAGVSNSLWITGLDPNHGEGRARGGSRTGVRGGGSIGLNTATPPLLIGIPSGVLPIGMCSPYS